MTAALGFSVGGGNVANTVKIIHQGYGGPNSGWGPLTSLGGGGGGGGASGGGWGQPTA